MKKTISISVRFPIIENEGKQIQNMNSKPDHKKTLWEKILKQFIK